MTKPSIQLVRHHVQGDSPLELSVTPQAADFCTVYDWRVTNPGPAVFRGTIRLHIDLPTAFTSPWLMVPGYIYGENRRLEQWSPKLYPRFDPSLRVPADMASSHWDFPTDRAAAPLVFVHQENKCFAVACAPHYDVSGCVVSDDPEPQVGVGFGHDGTAGYCRFGIPACEEPFTYSNAPDCMPTVNRITLPAGAAVSGKLYLYSFKGERHGYQRVLEHFYGEMAPSNPPAPLPEVVELVRDAAYGVVAGHYHEQGNYFIYSRPYDPVIEQIANARGITSEWHQMLVGFVGGFPICFGLLEAAELAGEEEARCVAIRVADKICREGISPSGLFWADFMPRTVESENGSFPNPLFGDRDEWGSGWLGQKTYVHSRTISDGCDNLAAMILREKAEHPDSPSLALWRGALVSNLEAALDLQLENGRYGQYYEAIERRVAKAEGCGGLPWIPAMIKALQLDLGDALNARMADSIRRAGEGYASDVEAEYIWGAPEDNDSPTSEDGMNAVMAYCDLYELTGEARYLELATIAADWLLTFRITYNEKLPPDSLMGRYGMRSMGGDYASASNNHPHVFGTLTTRHLCKLSDWTGNPYYRDRARDHWAFVCQYLSRCDGMYNGFRGAMAEQFYWCNFGSWSSWQPPAYHRQKGNMAPFTAVWCISVILQSARDAQAAFYEE